MKGIRNKIMKGKVYWTRSNGYLALINSSMILYLFLSKLRETGSIGWDVESYFFPIVAVGVILFILIGWFEVHVLRGFSEERKIGQRLDPVISKIERKVDELHDISTKPK